MSILNLVFGKIFSNVFVYNILFEDSEIDCKYIRLEHDSKVLTISGAGCGTSALLSYNPQSIDVVDSNLSHLSLSAIKILAPRYLTYDDFYQLFGYGKSDRAREMIFSILEDDSLPIDIKRYWQKKYNLLITGLYEKGLTSQLIQGLAKISSIEQEWSTEWLEEIAYLPEEKRVARVNRDVVDKLSHPLIQGFLASPFMILGLGVNFQQKAGIKHTEKMSFSDYCMVYIQKLARTDIGKNWFIWQLVVRKFNHQDNLSIPPYLRQNFYEKSLQSNTKISFHHGSIEKTLRDRPDNYWTYINLSDILDWMSDRQKQKILTLLSQKATAGAIVLIRSVEDIKFIKQLDFQDRFSLLQDISDLASLEDRSCLYKRVNFYKIIKL